MEPVDVARAILDGLLADDASVEAQVAAVLTWLDDNASRVGRNGVAWAASQAVQHGLDAIDAGAAARPTDAEVSMFRRLPVAGQVAVALHEFVGLDDDAVAEVTVRPVAEVKALLDSVGDLLDDPPAPTPGASPPAARPPAVRPTTDRPGSRSSAKARSRSKSTSARSKAKEPSTPPDSGSRATLQPRPSGRPRWWIIVAVVVLALIAAGIAASNLRDDAEPEASPSAAGLGDAATVRRDQLSAGCSAATGDEAIEPTTVTTQVKDSDRSYRLIAPAPIAPGRPRPLIIDLGDLGQSVDEHVAETRFDDLARALQIVVATAQPIDGYPQWNVTNDAGGANDLGLIDQVIKEQTRIHCIDQTRIILAGRGAGAHMAAAYACARPGAISGLIMVAGADRRRPCPTPARLSVLAILGADDNVYPMSGGNSPSFAGTFESQLRPGGFYEPAAPPRVLDAWAKGLDCVSTANQQIGLATAHIDTTCAENGEVWRVVIPGAGHEWYPATYDLLVQFLTTGPFAA